MAKLDINRMGDSTRVNRVDDQHNTMEGDLEEIFGIPDNVEITAHIFGKNPQGGKPIQQDGSIRGVPVLKSGGVQSSASTAVGFKFDDGSNKKLLVFVDSELKIYKDDDYPNESWVISANIERPGAGLLTSLADYIGSNPLTVADVNKLLKVASDGGGGYAFDLVDPQAGTGITTFVELEDGPGGFGNAGDLLATNGAGDELVWTAPPTAATPFVMLAYAQTSDGWGYNGGDWLDAYNWNLDSGGGFTIDDESTYLGNDEVPDPDQASKFFKNLAPGMYDFSLWYSTEDGGENIAGTREFRLQGTGVSGPAVFGVAQRATVGFYQDPTTLKVTPKAINGNKFLGSRMFIVSITTTNLKVQLKQTSGGKIGSDNDVWFYAVIRRLQ